MIFDEMIQLILHSKVAKAESYLIGGYHNDPLYRNLSYSQNKIRYSIVSQWVMDLLFRTKIYKY